MGKLLVRSVIDGNVYDYDDDGHQKGKPDQPMPTRALVQRMLGKPAPDGDAAFKLVERPTAVNHGRYTSEPLVGPLWSSADDGRLESFLSQRERAKDRTPRGSVNLPLADKLTGRAKERAESSKQASATAAHKAPKDAA